jgi:Family of unknown function (DUF6152)
LKRVKTPMGMTRNCDSAVRITACAFVLCAAIWLPQRSFSHHSATEYDWGRIVEVEGVLVELRWQNPHVRLKVRSGEDARGKPIIWDIETNSLSVMRRTNATPEKLRVGDRIKVAGEPSKRAPHRMFALHLLQADGAELVFQPGMRPRWRTAAAGSASTWFDAGAADKAGAGIFRVWSSKLDDPDPFWLANYPMTQAARAIAAIWDPISDSVANECEPKGMPTIMEQPYPMEFVRQKDTILLRMEEYDTVRTIHMSDKVNHASLPRRLLGRSTGKWEGSTLVVKTDGITWQHLDASGTPLSPDATLVERFTPSADGARLHYILTVNDPQFLTRPVELKRSWVARPNESVKPYNCGKS